MESLKTIWSTVVQEAVAENVTLDDVYQLIETPKQAGHGDLAFPCFILAKQQRKAPTVIASELAERLHHPWIKRVVAVGGYVNVLFHRNIIANQVLKQILDNGSTYGSNSSGNNANVPIDFSSPNIAKPFSMGHLRSTVIGQSIARLAEKNGYMPIRINYIGDWGTQFGKLIAAYTLWHTEYDTKADPIRALFQMYVRFHKEAKHTPELEDAGRQWFVKLEAGDADALALWRWFRELSLESFNHLYQRLNVSFDLVRGEAYYNDKMKPIVNELKSKGLLEESQGASVVRLDGEVPPCLIQKKDGASLYATRDLAAAFDRHTSYEPTRMLYVVGQEQALHFVQVKEVLKKMGASWADQVEHVSFGLLLSGGKKMSTRKGHVVMLEDVLDEAKNRALASIQARTPHLFEMEKVAEKVAVGALIFHDLKHYRQNDVEFSLEQMLTFEGETGPYLQYTFARAKTLLEKGGWSEADQHTITEIDEEAWPIVKALEEWPAKIKQAWQQTDPSLIARHLLSLAKAFNTFYSQVRIIDDSANKATRLTIVWTVATVLEDGLKLLGIQAPEKM
ncbi:arginine--tRNA ligase [Aureibacillus halotolerans]|uniref:Arginine--tRNA ligase n=1 Tax=Aureibacillus halotolerans TaxID=1508390 RepID=A0A4R6U2Y7_9BACI|nr:arginine--tRNA ligase [Aureibacillus halotolerans]TDQ37474.1 arginyl-tRNA synthetase [Aureibacillus halotolerans]